MNDMNETHQLFGPDGFTFLHFSRGLHYYVSTNAIQLFLRFSIIIHRVTILSIMPHQENIFFYVSVVQIYIIQ